MKYFYYTEDEKQYGPFTIEELKSKRLKKNVLVWTEGMSEWMKIGEIDELKDFAISVPPPIPVKNKKNPYIETFWIESNDSKQYLIYASIVVLIAYILLYLFIPHTGVFALCVLFLRIISAIIVYEEALLQNRSTTPWVICTVLFPFLSLLIMGLTYKEKISLTIDNRLPFEIEKDKLFKKAQFFYDNKYYAQCIQILSKIIEKDDENYESIDLRASCYYNMSLFEKSKNDLMFLQEKNQLSENGKETLRMIIRQEVTQTIKASGKCPICDFEISEESEKCPNCGTDLILK